MNLESTPLFCGSHSPGCSFDIFPPFTRNRKKLSFSEIFLTFRTAPPFDYLLYLHPVFWQCGAVCLKEIVSVQRKWRGAGVSGAKLTAEHVVLWYDLALTRRWWKTKKLTLWREKEGKREERGLFQLQHRLPNNEKRERKQNWREAASLWWLSLLSLPPARTEASCCSRQMPGETVRHVATVACFSIRGLTQHLTHTYTSKHAESLGTKTKFVYTYTITPTHTHTHPDNIRWDVRLQTL